MGDGKGVEVLWKCMDKTSAHDRARDLLRESGWEITAERETCTSLESMMVSILGKDKASTDVWFNPRRKRIEGDIIAQRPSAHSEVYLPPNP